MESKSKAVEDMVNALAHNKRITVDGIEQERSNSANSRKSGRSGHEETKQPEEDEYVKIEKYFKFF